MLDLRHIFYHAARMIVNNTEKFLARTFGFYILCIFRLLMRVYTPDDSRYNTVIPAF